MDNDFCVLKGLIGIFKKGVYCSTLVKKSRYFPIGILYIWNQCPLFKTEIGEHDFLSVNWKGVEFDVFVIKEPNCNMIMIST